MVVRQPEDLPHNGRRKEALFVTAASFLTILLGNNNLYCNRMKRPTLAIPAALAEISSILSASCSPLPRLVCALACMTLLFPGTMIAVAAPLFSPAHKAAFDELGALSGRALKTDMQIVVMFNPFFNNVNRLELLPSAVTRCDVDIWSKRQGGGR
jgi:hypothetical protein